jgi:hypothetical protein
MAEKDLDNSVHISGRVTGPVIGGGGTILGGVNTTVGSADDPTGITDALASLSRALADNRASLTRVEDLEDTVHALRTEVEARRATPGMLRTVLEGIVAASPGVGAVADAVARVRAAVGV